jgi:hypothetical protein
MALIELKVVLLSGEELTTLDAEPTLIANGRSVCGCGCG